jgi:AcrR family transcriptional regulator
MTPRKYDLGQRATASAATRQRIIEAAVALHREQGVMATTYRDVAARADVGLGTVYRHFPAVEDLVMACGAHLTEKTRPPTPAVFEGLRSRRARVERLVSEVFGWYERYPQWRRAICDADKLDVLARGVQGRNQVIHDLIITALELDAETDESLTVAALLNFEVYRSLVDAGKTTVQASGMVAKILLSGSAGTRG